jgi:hypothetical protein
MSPVEHEQGLQAFELAPTLLDKLVSAYYLLAVTKVAASSDESQLFESEQNLKLTVACAIENLKRAMDAMEWAENSWALASYWLRDSVEGARILLDSSE